MGLSTSINGVPVKASRGPSGYSFRLQDVLEAAGVPEGTARKITSMYRDSGDAARSGLSRLWFVGTGGIRGYISRVREGLPADAAAMTEAQRDESAAMDCLDSCVAACERWADSRRIPGWEPAGDGPAEADRAVMIDGILVRAVRLADGTYYFDLSGMLRAAGIPDDKATELTESYNRSGHAVGYRFTGVPGLGYLADLEACGDFVARQRGAARAGLDAAIRRDGAKAALDALDETEDALCRLEECITECRSWISFREGCPEGEAGDGPSPCCGGRSGTAGWGSPGIDPYDEPGLVPDEAASMADRLLDRLPVLCRAFGISQFMGREWQLARIAWLMAFHDGPVDAPEDGSSEAAFLWRGKDRCRISDLVGAAMEA